MEWSVPDTVDMGRPLLGDLQPWEPRVPLEIYDRREAASSGRIVAVHVVGGLGRHQSGLSTDRGDYTAIIVVGL